MSRPVAGDRAAERAALLELGAAVAAGMRGGSGPGVEAVGDALAALPRAPLELVGLIRREARRRRPDPDLVAALAFMHGQALEALRYGVERQDPEAAAMLEAVRGRVAREARAGDADPAVLMLLAKQFAVARVDVGAELRGAMGDMLDERAAEAAEGGAGDADMEQHLDALARELGDDPFALHAELAETAAAFPADHRLAMASFMLASSSAPVREAALGWLFDPAPGVAPALCGALGAEAAAGRLGGATLRRLVAARNWLPAEVRPGVDDAVRAARRRGGEPAAAAPSAVEEIRLSGIDGSGAVGAFALVRGAGGATALASLLFRFGEGVRDASVRRGLGRAEARALLARAGEGEDLVPASPAALRRLVSHMLSLNAAGAPPPFGALDAAEALGLGVVNPAPLPPEEAAALALEGSGPLPEAAAALAGSAAWPDRYGFMASWFEDGRAVEAALGGRRGLSRARKSALVLERVVAPRRRRWGELLAWTALVTADNGAGEEAARFALVALACLGDGPAEAVPLLRSVAEATVEARRARQG